MECCMLIVNIMTIIVAIVAMYVAVHVAQMTCKVQFLLKCRADWATTVAKKDLECYEELRNYTLEQISYLGDDFKKCAEEYKKATESNDIDSPKEVLKKIDELFDEKIKKYKKYIKV